LITHGGRAPSSAAAVGTPAAARGASTEEDAFGLTPREREVVRLVASGLSNEDIARELVISPLTAKTHITRAITKLGVRDRVQLVILAYEDGLVGPLS
jgi:DNA-binding NarL/FixJ family response regulator